MPPDAGAIQRADQIAHRFFTKFALIVDNARNVASEPREEAKTDKWFNLETPESDAYKDPVRLYRSISQLGASPPPLELQVLLTVPELTDKQVLVQHPPNSSRLRVEPTPTSVLLESWTLTFIGTSGGSASSSMSSTGEVPAPTVYKHIMIVFRSLFTLLRILPAWKICKRLRRRPGASTRNGHLGVNLRVRARGTDASATEDTRYLGFDEPLSPSSPPLATATHTFEPVTHPMGIFSLAVTYLTAPHFELDTVEALLSSRFLASEAGPEFTPTLARNSQRESMSGSPGSLPMRTSLPLSPPTDRTDRERAAFGIGLGTGVTSSAADRFVFPPSNPASGSRSSFPSTSPRSRNVALPPAGQVQRSISAQQAQAAAGSGSAGSIGSSSRQSREEGREGLSSVARVRRESTGMGRGSDLPSTPGPLLIRKPSTTVNPFKSSTLSSGSPSIYSNSPSLRQASPLAGPSLPSVPAGRASSGVPPSPSSTRAPPYGAGPSSPISGFRAGSSPVLPLRPSPPTPFAPSSLGERRFPASPAGPSPTGESLTSGMDAPPRRKRYSSSFGHRYNIAGSQGSAESGEKGKEPERGSGNASYLSTNTDDDDISSFVKAIDTRKPIGGGFNSRHDRERTLSEAAIAGRAVLSGAEFPEQTQPGGEQIEKPEAEPQDRRSVSEGSAPAQDAADTARNEESGLGQGYGQGQGQGQPSGNNLNQGDTFERLRMMQDAFNTSMGLVERRASGAGEDGELSVPLPTAQPRPLYPGPGAAHLRTPSFSASGGEHPALGQWLAPAPGQRTGSTSRGNLSTDNATIWDNRRPRADSSESVASGLSERDRARLFYRQGHDARGSVDNTSLDEAVGKFEMDRESGQE